MSPSLESRRLQATEQVTGDLEAQEAADMVSLPPSKTGVPNTLFVSTKGYARHAARIKIAIDPLDSLNAAAETASMAIHDFQVAGDIDPRIAKQAQQFILRNREALLDYWEQRIDTVQLIERLK